MDHKLFKFLPHIFSSHYTRSPLFGSRTYLKIKRLEAHKYKRLLPNGKEYIY